MAVIAPCVLSSIEKIHKRSDVLIRCQTRQLAAKVRAYYLRTLPHTTDLNCVAMLLAVQVAVTLVCSCIAMCEVSVLVNISRNLRSTEPRSDKTQNFHPVREVQRPSKLRVCPEPRCRSSRCRSQVWVKLLGQRRLLPWHTRLLRGSEQLWDGHTNLLARDVSIMHLPLGCRRPRHFHQRTTFSMSMHKS